MKSLALFLFFALPSFASSPTLDLVGRCQKPETQESVLKELEQESGLNFDLESLAGDEALSSLIEDLQNSHFSEKSAQTLQNIQRILGIARRGVSLAAQESLQQGLNKEIIEASTNLSQAMMDIFSPVLDMAQKGLALQAQGKNLSEEDISTLMDLIRKKSDLYQAGLAQMTALQIKIEKMNQADKTLLNSALDQHTLNTHKQTCLAAVAEIRK